jgi:hypothetical protein
MRRVAIKILPKTAQDTGSTRLTPQNFMKKPKYGTSGEVWKELIFILGDRNSKSL